MVVYSTSEKLASSILFNLQLISFQLIPVYTHSFPGHHLLLPLDSALLPHIHLNFFKTFICKSIHLHYKYLILQTISVMDPKLKFHVVYYEKKTPRYTHKMTFQSLKYVNIFQK